MARRFPGFFLYSAGKSACLYPSCRSARTIPSREIENLDRGFSRPELPEDFRFALSSRNSFPQSLVDRSTVQDNHAIRGADNEVARANCNSAQLDWLVQCADLFFLASADRQAATKHREATFGDGFNVAHRTVDDQPCDTSRLCCATEHFSPCPGVLVSFGSRNQHAARLCDCHRMMQHEIVARGKAYGKRGAANLRAMPHGFDCRIYHSSLAGCFV